MNTLKHSLLVLALASGSGAARAQSLGVFLNAPRTTNSTFSNTTVETFNSLSTGIRTSTYHSAIGDYQASASNPMGIEAGSVPWSFDGTTHMAVGSQSGSTSPVSLVFATPQTYFGFGWAAGDGQNRMTFYNGSTTVGTFSTATIQSILSGSTVTTGGGTTYATSLYRGQPGSPTTNAGENYAFVNFIADGGLTFDRIAFSNTNTGSGFESDNHTILSSGTATVGSSFVQVTYVSGSAAPEPASFLFLALGALPLGIFARRPR